MDYRAIIVLGIVLVIFFVTFILNMKIKKPDGCEISSNCSKCKLENCYMKNKIKTGEKYER